MYYRDGRGGGVVIKWGIIEKDNLALMSFSFKTRVLGSVTSELLMCDGGMHSILLLSLVAKYIDT